jgi:hypothetical protein
MILMAGTRHSAPEARNEGQRSISQFDACSLCWRVGCSDGISTHLEPIGVSAGQSIQLGLEKDVLLCLVGKDQRHRCAVLGVFENGHQDGIARGDA